MNTLDLDSNLSGTPQRKNNVDALWRLQKIILDTLDFKDVVQKIVNALLIELGYLNMGYRIIVLTLINREKGVLQRIALSSTPEAELAQEASAVPFHDIEIPLSASDNVLIRVIQEKKALSTHYWPELFTPILTSEQAILNQTASGIKTSLVYPVIVHNEPIGALIFSMKKEETEVTEEEKELIRGFTEIVGIAIQNSTLYSSLEKATEELKKANEQLQILDKLKDEFVSLASHELRTPMTAIKSYVWLLMYGNMGQLSDKQKIYLERTYSATDRLIKLVNDMLNISRIESGRLTLDRQPTEINKLIEEVIFEVQARADELGLHIAFERNENVSLIDADPARIKEVLINLIGNSLKFTPQGGSIEISISSEEGFIKISVKDTGQGIKQEDIAKLFKKFNTIGDNLTKQKGQGTGLGLYLSKSLVELHGGKIWAESRGPGAGSTFSFTLPNTKSPGA